MAATIQGKDLRRQGILCIVSGPSGSGKTTLCRTLSREDPRCVYSISCTTRPPRDGEIDGRDYHFLSVDEFERRAVRGEFLEHARVHGNCYGTLRSWVAEHLEAGTDVLMDIDVQGAALVRGCDDPFIQRALVDVFILPPDLEELRARLTGRATEDEAQVALRLRNAEAEMAHWREYGFVIVSGSRGADLDRFRSILAAERLRASRMRAPAPAPVAAPGTPDDLFDTV